MSKLACVLTVLAIVAGGALFWRLAGTKEVETVFEPPTKILEAGSPCPWRNLESDMTNWFPGATGYEVHDLTLSSQRLVLQQKLGRALLPGEMSLRYYLIDSGTAHVGSVLPSRVKGPHGAIEIVTAIDGEATPPLQLGAKLLRSTL